jgi:hypothetical protein
MLFPSWAWLVAAVIIFVTKMIIRIKQIKQGDRPRLDLGDPWYIATGACVAAFLFSTMP